MFDFSQFKAGTEEQFLAWYFAKTYKVANTAVTIRERNITPGPKDQVKLVLDIRLGSSPTRGTETYTRLDLTKMFLGMDTIRMGAGGPPTVGEFTAYIQELIQAPIDGIAITNIGNAYTLTARPTSLLFIGKKTLYVG
jgi:hypothetical protein